MDIEPVWYQYATFDENGFINGVADDAPDSAKKAYMEYIERNRGIEQSGGMIPR